MRWSSQLLLIGFVTIIIISSCDKEDKNDIIYSATGIKDGHEYVDLGLSVKWATHNVGANDPEDCGEYYAWAEIETKINYSWSSYKYCNGDRLSLTKYNSHSTYGTEDYKTILDSIDDVAQIKWGGNWRIPTTQELVELYENCSWELTTYNGVRGYRITSKIKKSSSTSQSIFLPVAGYKEDSTLVGNGSVGYYWLNMIHAGFPDMANCIEFDSQGPDGLALPRYRGFTVRPVCP